MENYSRVKQIGEGAFGKAILVRAKVTGDQAVIKEINISRMKAKEREDSRKEVAVLAQLKHPNIVTYRESFEERGSLFIVMDYCAGGDLYSKINNQRGLLFSEEQVWNWFIQTCLAIKHIHDRKILHRDIKSQNIFLTNDGKIQVGDFGIAKVLNSTVELARTCIGTPYYLSPEIVENKPYNNKSDIWSLGCVLYELSTLKHAFEAGNMKNLVLKIIRGSYPPIPPKYSYELRGLIAQLFKRAPRDRPSINAILKKNFIISRVRNLLPEEKMREEFSHTLLHGQKIARALPPPPRPASAGPKRVTPSPRPGSAAGRYNPAAVYGAPLARKSKERPDLKKKNASGGRIVPGQQDWEKRKQDMVQKENRRREDAKKREQDMYAQKHKEFIDRQKMARMNKAREEGWRNVIDSGEEDRSTPTPTPAVHRPLPKPVVAKSADPPPKDRGNFDAYNDYLNKIRGNNNARVYEAPPVAVPRNNAGNYMAAPRGVPQQAVGKADRDYINRALQRGPAYNPVKQSEDNRRAIAQAEERGRLAEDFLQRKREAALNKKRGHAQLYGYTPPATPVSRPGSARRPGSSGGRGGGGGANSRNREEQEYLEKLRQIREQNMKERRMLQGKVDSEKPNTPQDLEDRKKKMAALRKQAEEWSQKKKDQLEKEKKEILDRMKAREEYMKQREQEARKERAETPRVNLKPVTPVPITGALHAIGAVEEKQPSPERPRSAVQQKKDEILKRLNNKQDKERGQWGSPQTPDLATEDDDGSETARSRWGDGGNTQLANLPLEQTASQMEATSAGDRVVQGGVSSPPVVTPRNQWGKPGGTVVGVLQKLPICDATMTIDSNKIGGSTSSEGFEPHLSPSPAPPVTPISSGVGATITISKSPVQKGTIIIKAADADQSKAVKGVDADTADKTLSSKEQEAITETEAETETSSDNPEVFNESKTESSEQQASQKESEDVNKSDDKTNDIDQSKAKANDIDQSEAKTNDIDQSEQEKQDSKDTNMSKEEATEQLEDLTEETVQPDGKEKGESVDENCRVEEFKERVVHPGKTFDVFPKPRLLPKPDQPLQFSVKAPVVGRSEGAGSLFEKVELEEEEETEGAGGDSQDGKEKKKEEKEVEVEIGGDGNKFVTKGITTGQFDMNDVGLLRTASEPDLSKLGTAERVTPATLSRHISMDLSVVQEETETLDTSVQEEGEGSPDTSPILSPRPAPVSPSRSPRQRRRDKQRASRDESKKVEAEKDDDDSDDDDDDEEDDYDDLMSVRETMQSLLIDDDNDPKIKFSLSNDSESQEVEQKTPGGGRDTEGGEKGDKDGEEEEEEDEEEDDEEDELKNLEDEEEDNDRISTADLFDDSDGATEFGDDDQQEDEDLFSRLEQQRAELEAALGDKLIDVYKAVQAMQEDEDGNLEEGARIAMEMLGKEHEHLYPKIFQLVISDTAYTEDNV